jgi:hypothetical protein
VEDRALILSYQVVANEKQAIYRLSTTYPFNPEDVVPLRRGVPVA